MTNLISAILFLLTPPATNAPVCDFTGAVKGKWDAVICREALITLATNGVFQLQVSEIATNNSWVGVAVVYGDRTNRVQVPTQGGYLRLMHREY